MNELAIPRDMLQFQQSYCDRASLENLGSEIFGRKWHADLLDDHGDPCGRMLLGVDSSLPAHASMRWSCQLNAHFASEKYHDGPLACGIGDTPQAAYEAACTALDRFERPLIAAMFRRFNRD